MKDEGIKAVEMTRQIRDRMYEETKDMGQEEFLRYVKQRSAAASEKVEQRESLVADPSAGGASRR